MKEYIEYSNEFRKSNGSKESVEKMYDLLYELESIEKNKQESLVLSNVYILLGFHRSAFEIFKEAADSKTQRILLNCMFWSRKRNRMKTILL